jgi:hypothetical protein
MDVATLLARASSAIGQGAVYELGAGGMFPEHSLPMNVQGRCDCSGFVCWALGISRKTEHPLYRVFNGGWINTDAIVHDARQEVGFFSRLQSAVPGGLLVFPAGKIVAPGKAPKKYIGHVGIVHDVAGGVVNIIHCSSSNYTKTGDAIRLTDDRAFRNNANTIVAWYAGLEA